MHCMENLAETGRSQRVPWVNISPLCFPSLGCVSLGNQSSCVSSVQPVFLWCSRCLLSLDKQRSWGIPDKGGWLHHSGDIIVPQGQTRASSAFDPNHNRDPSSPGVSPCLPQLGRGISQGRARELNLLAPSSSFEFKKCHFQLLQPLLQRCCCRDCCWGNGRGKKPSCFLLVGEGKAEQNSASKGREANPTENKAWDWNCLCYLSRNWADIPNSCSPGRWESLQELHEPGAEAPELSWSSRNGRELDGNTWNWWKKIKLLSRWFFGVFYVLIFVMLGVLMVGEESLRPGGFWLQR